MTRKMTRRLSAILLASAFVMTTSFSCVKKKDPASWVDPFIGTDLNIHCFPGATVPFGMLQPGPQSGNFAWNYCGGYHATDSTLIGFSQNRLSGSGGAGFGDVLIMPFSKSNSPVYVSRFTNDVASPGYYKTDLPDNGVTVEVTVAPRTALYRISYDDPNSRKMYLNLQSFILKRMPKPLPIKVNYTVDFPDANTITGFTSAFGRPVYYKLQFDTPIVSKEEVHADTLYATPQYIVDFGSGKAPVKVKAAISAVDAKGAADNLAELATWDFDKVATDARALWNEVFGTAEIEGASPDVMTKFYTAIYHSCIHPSLFSDVDGRFLGPDGQIHQSVNQYYTLMSLWDTFRSVHPLISLMLPQYNGPIIGSMFEHYDIHGLLPVWTSWGGDGYGMQGDPGVPVVMDAYMKGYPEAPLEKTYEAIKKSLTTPHREREFDELDKYGYFPNDGPHDESASRTLECSYDAWCAAELAKKLGKTEDYEYFMKRSNMWKNLFDHAYNLVRGRDSKGNWTTPFDPLYLCNSTHPGDYTEANAWQYTWHVLQDPEGLMEEMGGRDAFVAKLDSFFTCEPDDPEHWLEMDLTGRIGYHVQGNELSLHIPYLYTVAGRLDKTSEIVRKICTELYDTTPGGIPGNDDCGATSSWYFFSALGFFPVSPASQEYILGAPQVPHAVLHLSGGDLEIVAKDLSEENLYVESVTLNGKPIDKKFTFYDIKDGGRLEFQMGPKPVHD